MSEPVVVKAGALVRQKIGVPASAAAIGAKTEPEQPNNDYPPLPQNHPLRSVPDPPPPVRMPPASNRMVGNTGPGSPTTKRANGNAGNGYGPSDPKRRQPMPSSLSSQTAPVPISALNPFQNRWVTKGRVVNKSGIRTWVNPKVCNRNIVFPRLMLNNPIG